MINHPRVISAVFKCRRTDRSDDLHRCQPIRRESRPPDPTRQGRNRGAAASSAAKASPPPVTPIMFTVVANLRWRLSRAVPATAKWRTSVRVNRAEAARAGSP